MNTQNLKQALKKHQCNVTLLTDSQLLHETMNRYAEMSEGWTRDSMIVEKELTIAKNEVLRRMQRGKTYYLLIGLLVMSFVVNLVLCLYILSK